MNTTEYEAVGIGQQWVAKCNSYAFLVIALKRLMLAGPSRGLMRSEITKVAHELVDIEDRLRSLGYHPSFPLGGESERLWEATKNYMFSLPWMEPPAETHADELAEDVARIQAAWVLYEATVYSLNEESLLAASVFERWAIRPKGAQRLLGLFSSHLPAVEQPIQHSAQLSSGHFVFNTPVPITAG